MLTSHSHLHLSPVLYIFYRQHVLFSPYYFRLIFCAETCQVEQVREFCGNSILASFRNKCRLMRQQFTGLERRRQSICVHLVDFFPLTTVRPLFLLKNCSCSLVLMLSLEAAELFPTMPLVPHGKSFQWHHQRKMWNPCQSIVDFSQKQMGTLLNKDITRIFVGLHPIR